MKNMFWLASFLGAACHRSQAAQPPQAPPGEAWISQAQADKSGIKMSTIGENDVGTQVTTSGRITFDDLKVSHVFSPVTGRITQIFAQPGQRVKKGDPLAEIESPDVGVASSDFDKARADLDAAQHELNRQKELYEAHAAAQRDYEQAENNEKKARAEFQRAQQKTKLLRSSGDAVSQGYALRALIDGEVIARNVNPGAEVQGQYGGGTAVELFTIGELDTVWVIADLFEMDLSRVKVGAEVDVKVVAYPDKSFNGTVDWVADALDPATRSAKVRCRVQNPDRLLKPEMFATVILSAQGHKVLSVPRNAVLHLGEKTVVFVQSGIAPTGELRFERRPVMVDEDESGDELPVLHGLKVGDRIVTDGAILLSGLS
jgi:cobalt-zinc-cadmium efflux system membrane fusion protein